MLAGNADITRESIGIGVRGATPVAMSRELPPSLVGRERAKDVWMIDVDRIAPDPDQPRKEVDPDALARLAESLRTRGQFQPIQVRWDEAAERHVIIMGERRWRAATLAGLPKLACVVRTGEMSDDERLSIQLVENCLREDLAPVDQARAFRRLMDSRGLTREQVAAELSINKETVGRVLSLLTLPEAVRDAVDDGSLPASAAFAIAKLDDPGEQSRLAKAAVEGKLTRDDVAKQVRASRPVARKRAAKARTMEIHRFNGYRIEVTRKGGVDDAGLCEALEDMLAKFRRGADASAA